MSTNTSALLIAILLLSHSTPAAESWHHTPSDHRISFDIAPDSTARMNRIAQIPLDFTPASKTQPFDPRTLRIIEVDADGQLLNDAVPNQFDRAPDFDPATKPRGTLCLILQGRTSPQATRHYQAYYTLTGKISAAPAIAPYITVTDKQIILTDLECFKIQTTNATYIYGKDGGGFASIIDRDGNDWISYSHNKNAAGEYHGLPKFGHPEKLFHAGYKGFRSTLTADGPLHAQISSDAIDGKSSCTWDFYPTYATVTLTKFKLPSYWFLYEGTPGGKLDVEKDFVVRSNGKKTPLSEPWTDNIPWVYFTVPQTNYALFMAAHQKHDKVDSYVAWPFKPEADGSYQQMTVFGFGRKGYKELVQHIADLTELPARYTIGFVDDPDFTKASATIESAYRDVKVTVHPAQTRE